MSPSAMYSFEENHFLEVAGVALESCGGRRVACSWCCDRLQSRWRGESFQKRRDLFSGAGISIFHALLSKIGRHDDAHQAETVIEDDERPRDHEHHFRQFKVAAGMDWHLWFEKSNHVVTGEADRTALKMGNVVARNKAKFVENLLQFAERIGGVAIGGGARFFANS